MRLPHSFFVLFFLLLGFLTEPVIAQVESSFSTDNNKFFAGLDLCGGFPLGNFTSIETHYPCNSAVNTGTLYDLTLGCRLNQNYGLIALLYYGAYEVDPSSLGVSQLINASNGIYENAEVLKSGPCVTEGINIGMYYNFPFGKNNHIFFRPRILIGITGCRLPEIEIVANHNPTVANTTGYSIDTVETWDTPTSYAYMLNYRIGAGMYYQLNKRADIFITLDYQGSPLDFNNIPTSYSLVVNSANTITGTSLPLSSTNILYISNPKVNYQTINLSIGGLFRF